MTRLLGKHASNNPQKQWERARKWKGLADIASPDGLGKARHGAAAGGLEELSGQASGLD
jgi:hypothetical protein